MIKQTLFQNMSAGNHQEIINYVKFQTVNNKHIKIAITKLTGYGSIYGLDAKKDFA